MLLRKEKRKRGLKITNDAPGSVFESKRSLLTGPDSI